MTYKQSPEGDQRNYTHHSLVDVNPSDYRGIEPQKVKEEAPGRINNQIEKKDVAAL
jgi:hypothetical protein